MAAGFLAVAVVAGLLVPGRAQASVVTDTTADRRAGSRLTASDNRAVAYDEHLADRIRELVVDEQGLTEMKMFGGLAFLIDGNMSVSASGRAAC